MEKRIEARIAHCCSRDVLVCLQHAYVHNQRKAFGRIMGNDDYAAQESTLLPQEQSSMPSGL